MLYVIGDVHGEREVNKLNSDRTEHIGKDDTVVILGDFGLLWCNPPTKSELWWLKWLVNRPFQVCFIDGNHENFDLLDNLKTEEFAGGLAGVAFEMDGKKIYHLKRGEIYTIDDVTFLTIGGALSIDKGFRKEGVSWWSREILDYSEMSHAVDNLEKHNNTVDCILTHTGPRTILDVMGFSSRGDIDPVSADLEFILNTAKFKKWFFGHMHIDDNYGDKFYAVYDNILKCGSSDV